jgi:hypothetical protein
MVRSHAATGAAISGNRLPPMIPPKPPKLPPPRPPKPPPPPPAANPWKLLHRVETAPIGYRQPGSSVSISRAAASIKRVIREGTERNVPPWPTRPRWTGWPEG